MLRGNNQYVIHEYKGCLCLKKYPLTMFCVSIVSIYGAFLTQVHNRQRRSREDSMSADCQAYGWVSYAFQNDQPTTPKHQ